MTNGVKQFAGEMKQATAEVVKDVKDSIGQALEQGIQSATGSPLTPQQIQQKQMEDQKKIANARKDIEFYKKTAEEQRQVREEYKQKEIQRLQNQQQEKQVTEMRKEEKKKEPVNPAVAYAGKAEFKRGVGG